MIPKYFNSIFESVKPLEEYLGLDFNELDIPLEDKNALNELSQQVLVAISNATGGIYECQSKFIPQTNIPEIGESIENVLADICVYILSNWQLSNVLASGCTLTPDKNSIQMKFNNTILSQIISNKAWSILFRCVEKQIFCDLFVNAIILYRLPKGVYYQLSGLNLTGTPLSLKNITLKPQKRKRLQTTVDQYKSTFLFDIASHNNDIPRYLDSLLFTKKRRKSTGCNEQPNKIQKLSRRQKKKLKQANASKIAATPKTKSQVEVIDKSQLFYCANSINPQTNKVVMTLPKDHLLKKGKTSNLDNNFLVYCMSKIFPREFTTPNKTTLHSNITKAASRHFEVFELITELVRRSFPIEFWGSKGNFDIICRAIKHFVTRRKMEKLSMTEIMHEFKILECKWLAPSHKQRVVPLDLQKRKSILQQALAWFFNDYIMPMLKSFFYITEHTKFGKETYYYRRDTWLSITKVRIEKLVQEDYFKEMQNTEMNIELGAGKIRFLPKEKGLRMITNMRNTTKLISGSTKGTIEEESVDTHSKLGPLLNVLQYEQNKNPDLMGSSVLGRHLLYKRFKAYTQKVLPTNSKFYFVKVDISNCFDNIDQIKLLSILDGVLRPGQYLSRRIASARPFSNKIMRKMVQFYGTIDDRSDISSCVDKLNDIRPGSILVDQNSHTTSDTRELYNLLEENISSGAVKFGTKYYKRQHGIAQGSRLSTLLCSFFFGRLEQDKLRYLKEDTEGILFTYIDDFLYITKNKEYAVQFLDTMTTDISDFKVSVNKDKCVTNINNDMPEFSWLGLTFDTKTLNVHIDKSARQKIDVTFSLTVEYSRKPSILLLNSGVRAIKSKFYDILMDSDINSKQSIARNLYDNFEFAALKIECQSKELSTRQIVIPLAPHGVKRDSLNIVI
ncbi:hypothetical protein INT46_004179 [Mucor plumbeus]|uniref:Telomerase reverse transcriptase n=1 Tax=Mucor plumbeus TaxID=97098 RepID=A0A8H7RU96_9FUNG|nr:hypothetical protein INT46_004179 [Mucor plumbeus]